MIERSKIMVYWKRISWILNSMSSFYLSNMFLFQKKRNVFVTFLLSYFKTLVICLLWLCYFSIIWNIHFKSIKTTPFFTFLNWYDVWYLLTSNNERVRTFPSHNALLKNFCINFYNLVLYYCLIIYSKARFDEKGWWYLFLIPCYICIKTQS